MTDDSRGWRVPWPGPIADLPGIGDVVEVRTVDGRERLAEFSQLNPWEDPEGDTGRLIWIDWLSRDRIPFGEVTHWRT